MKKFDKAIEKHNAKTIEKAFQLREAREFDKAIDIMLRIYKHHKQKNDLSIAYEALFFVVDCFLDVERYHQAIPYLEEIYEYCDSVKNFVLKASTAHDLGIAYGIKGNSEESLKYALEAYKLFKDLNDPRNMIVTLITIGNNYESLGKIEKLLKTLHRAEKIAY